MAIISKHQRARHCSASLKPYLAAELRFAHWKCYTTKGWTGCYCRVMEGEVHQVGDGGRLPWLGVHRNQLRAWGQCVVLWRRHAIAPVGTQTVDWALALELAHSKGPFPRVRRAIIAVASTSAFGVLAVEGKGWGAANHGKIKYACHKSFLGVFPSFRSSKASIEGFSIFP